MRAERRARFEEVTSVRRGKSSVGSINSGPGGIVRERDLKTEIDVGDNVPSLISLSRSTNSADICRLFLRAVANRMGKTYYGLSDGIPVLD